MAKKRRKVSKASKLIHYKSLLAQMEVDGPVTGIQRARYAKYVNAIKRLGGSVKSNPRGFGGAMLGRDRHGRFVKSNPRSAHSYGHTVGSYAKKGKRKAHAAYQSARSFFGGMTQGYRENPAMSFPQMGVVHNPYGGGLFGPKSNPKRHKSSSKAARGRALAHSLARDSKGRFVKRNPHRRGHYGY